MKTDKCPPECFVSAKRPLLQDRQFESQVTPGGSIKNAMDPAKQAINSGRTFRRDYKENDSTLGKHGVTEWNSD